MIHRTTVALFFFPTKIQALQTNTNVVGLVDLGFDEYMLAHIFQSIPVIRRYPCKT
jgi:hypothetical protein